MADYAEGRALTLWHAITNIDVTGYTLFRRKSISREGGKVALNVRQESGDIVKLDALCLQTMGSHELLCTDDGRREFHIAAALLYISATQIAIISIINQYYSVYSIISNNVHVDCIGWYCPIS